LCNWALRFRTEFRPFSLLLNSSAFSPVLSTCNQRRRPDRNVASEFSRSEMYRVTVFKAIATRTGQPATLQPFLPGETALPLWLWPAAMHRPRVGVDFLSFFHRKKI
jgi:hypothetical protein